MTDDQPEDPGIDKIVFAVPGLDYSQAHVKIGDSREWWLWFWNCMKVAIETREEVFGGHMVDEAQKAGAQPEAPPMPRTAHQNPQGERVNPNPTPAQQTPPASPAAPQGQFPEAWPPTVVATTEDDGTATVGCSYHKLRDGRPRPMRLLQGRMKCTGKSEKAGNQDGYCPLTHQAPQPAASDASFTEPDDLPF